MSYCRRCMNSNLGYCSFGYVKSDKQIRDENFGCFKERILKVFDENTKIDIAIEKGVYGDVMSPADIEKEINRINRLKGSILVGAEV